MTMDKNNSEKTCIPGQTHSSGSMFMKTENTDAFVKPIKVGEDFVSR